MDNDISFDTSLLFIPDGVRDVYGSECKKFDHICETIRSEMRLYGFRNIKTPSYEFFDIFNKERGTVSSNRMFKFFDRHNNTLVLRPDHTPQIARCVARYYKDEDMQLRLCYTGSIYMHHDGYQGKLSETTQIGGEIIGDSTSDTDGEMLTLTIECLKKCGLKEFKIDIGHAGIFRGLVREAGLSTDETAKLRTFIENKNSYAAGELIKDKSMNPGLRELLIKMPEIFADHDSLEFVKSRINDPEALEAIDRLEKIKEILTSSELIEYVNFDPGMLGRMDYYTGVIFKAFTYGTGEAIASGGRYDALMKQFGKDVPAVGVVFSIDQLMEALETGHTDVDLPADEVLILYRSANRTHAIETAHKLREAGTPSFLMRKNADTPLETYREYGKRHNLKQIRYIDDTGEETVLEL